MVFGGQGPSDDGQCVKKPWGDYIILDAGERYKVKVIRVVPGGKLSLQFHHHRAEHWVVVSGTGNFYGELSGSTKLTDALLTEGQHVFIPAGAVHRIINNGKIPLEFIEVQAGEYLGEDDIVRLDDAYGRVSPPNVTRSDQSAAPSDQPDSAASPLTQIPSR